MTLTSDSRSTSATGPKSRRPGPQPLVVSGRLRWVLAAGVAGAPLLIAVNGLFHPAVEMSGEGILAGAETGPGRWFVVHLVAAVGALLGVLAALGLRTLVVGRGRRVADASVAVTAVAAPVLALSFAVEASLLAVAAEALDEDSAVRLAVAYGERPEFWAVGIAVGLVTLANLMMGLALLIGGAVPRWQAVAYLLAVVGTAVSVPGSVVGPVFFGAVAAVSLLFADRVRRAASAR